MTIAIGLAAAALVVGAVAFTLGATDSPGHMNNQGTIKVHDDASVTPEQRNQPHVDCDFWIQGFDLNDDSGHIRFWAWPPTGDKREVFPTGASTTWTGTDGNFNAGPFFLPSGHYRVEVFTDAGHPGGEDAEDTNDARDPDANGVHFNKTKTFWVECESDEPAPEKPECPTVPVAAALQDESVRLTFTPPEGADSVRVYRAVGDGTLDLVATLAGDATTYHDTTTEVGVTYRYLVTAIDDGQESENCAIVEVTAIPFFPSWIVAALASAGVLAAFVALRRR